MATGVYLITNVDNGRIYIGSATNTFEERWKGHRKALRRGKHNNKKLQNSWIAHGEDAFVFEILEETVPDNAIAAEEFWINYFIYIGADVYNMCRYPTEGTRGQKLTQEHKDYLSEINSKAVYAFVGPDGTEYPGIRSLNRFAKENGLTPAALYYVAQGKHFQHKGWRLLENKDKPAKKPNPKFSESRSENLSKALKGKPNKYVDGKKVSCSVSDPSGIIYFASSIRELARITGLSTSTIRRLISGKILVFRGWTLVSVKDKAV